MDNVEAVKSVLRFYNALGIDRLPIELPSLKKKNRFAGNKTDALKALCEETRNCTKCRLSGGRTNVVFGEGSIDTTLMFIGEAPGREEDMQGRPFVGESGQMLTRLINKMGEGRGFERKDVYIGNIVKCRPPQNRDPLEDEIEACRPYIKRQVEIIAPRIIISLGRISAHALTGLNTPISRMRGQFFDFGGTPLMPTFHPAYLIRNPKDKALVWQDALKVLDRLKEDER